MTRLFGTVYHDQLIQRKQICLPFATMGPRCRDFECPFLLASFVVCCFFCQFIIFPASTFFPILIHAHTSMYATSALFIKVIAIAFRIVLVRFLHRRVCDNPPMIMLQPLFSAHSKKTFEFDPIHLRMSWIRCSIFCICFCLCFVWLASISQCHTFFESRLLHGVKWNVNQTQLEAFVVIHIH